MNRSNLKGKSKGIDPPRREPFDDLDDGRSAPRYRTDDRMDLDDYDDPIEYRRSDRRGIRRDTFRDDDWDDHRETRRDDNRGQDRRDRSGDRREATTDDLMSQYISTTDIEWEVISSDIQIYLGPEATVKRVSDPQVRGLSRQDPKLLLTSYRIVVESYTWYRQNTIFLRRYESCLSLLSSISL
jgi:hypothetical protein